MHAENEIVRSRKGGFTVTIAVNLGELYLGFMISFALNFDSFVHYRQVQIT